jgi:5-methylcytosine-specific restriction endonuclease McrA
MIHANCRNCDKAFDQAARYYKNRKPLFCSPKCGYAYKRSERGKPTVAIDDKHTRVAFSAARKRDGSVCCACGLPDSKQRRVSVDHIFPRRLLERWGLELNNLVNLASLCSICHGKKTALEIKLFKGDVVGFVLGLAGMNYPQDRILAAVHYAGFSSSLVDRVYGAQSLPPKKGPQGEPAPMQGSRRIDFNAAYNDRIKSPRL